MPATASAPLPRRRDDVEAHRVRDELVLYCPVRESAFSLNKSSRIIWELCDGQHTQSEIAWTLAGQLDCDGEVVEPELAADVAMTVAQFRTNGLLDVSQVPPADPA